MLSFPYFTEASPGRARRASKQGNPPYAGNLRADQGGCAMREQRMLLHSVCVYLLSRIAPLAPHEAARNSSGKRIVIQLPPMPFARISWRARQRRGDPPMPLSANSAPVSSWECSEAMPACSARAERSPRDIQAQPGQALTVSKARSQVVPFRLSACAVPWAAPWEWRGTRGSSVSVSCLVSFGMSPCGTSCFLFVGVAPTAFPGRGRSPLSETARRRCLGKPQRRENTFSPICPAPGAYRVGAVAGYAKYSGARGSSGEGQAASCLVTARHRRAESAKA